MRSISEALTTAGYETPQAKLDRLTREAITAAGASWDARADKLYQATRNDPVMLWEIMGTERRRLYDAQIKRVQEQMREELAKAPAPKGDGGTGQTSSETHQARARPSVAPPSPLRAVSGRETKQWLIPGSAVSPAALPSTESPARPVSGRETIPGVSPTITVSPAAPLSRRDQGGAIVSEIARQSLLDTMRINGQPLRNASVIEARKWGESRERDGRFIRLLLTGVPDAGTVGDYATDKMAEDAMRLAAEASNA